MEDLMALFESRGIDHVGIRYRDLPRAVAWFRNVLGLQIDHQTQTMAFVHVARNLARSWSGPAGHPCPWSTRFPTARAVDAAAAP